MVEKQNILNINNRQDFRKWLEKNSESAKECFVVLKRGKPKDDDVFYYLDAVEEALCFGWIDSTLSKVNGITMQRFAPRTKNSHWTQLNIERVNRLKSLGLMTLQGLKVVPTKEFIMDQTILDEMEMAKVKDTFIGFPKLYQRIRMDNLLWYKLHYPSEYRNAFNHFLEETKKNKMYGQWNDYGRLK